MRLDRIRTDLRLTVLAWTRHKGQVAVGLLMPVLVLLVFGFVFGASLGTPPLHVVDGTDGGAGGELVDRLRTNTSLETNLVDPPPGREELEQWMASREVAALLWIGPGYGNASANGTGDAPALELYIDASRSRGVRQVPSLVRAAVAEDQLDRGNGTGAADLEYRAVGRVTELAFQGYGYQDFLLSGMLGLVVLSMAMMGTSGLVSTYRRQGMFKRLGTTPLRKSEWLLSKLVTQQLLSFAGAVTVVGVSVLVFQTRVRPHPLLLVVLAVGAGAFAAFGLALAGAVRDPSNADQITNLVYIPLMFLSETFVPAEQLPQPLEFLSLLSPLTYFVRATEATLLYYDGGTVVRGLAVLTALGVASLAIGTRVIEWGESGG